MPTPTKGPRLGGSPAHERLMLANLATALFQHGRITTTQAKARRLRPLAEKLITFAKRGDLHARRQVLTVVRDKDVVYRLFDEIGPRYFGRPGGYTRIVKLQPRQGDNAPMAIIELVEASPSVVTDAGRAARLRQASQTEAEESVAALAGEKADIASETAATNQSASDDQEVAVQSTGQASDSATEAKPDASANTGEGEEPKPAS